MPDWDNKKTDRRGWLRWLGVAGIGGGVVYVYLEGIPDELPLDADDIQDQASTISGPPETKTKIDETGPLTARFGGAPIDNIEFYESGAAVVTPIADRGSCQERFAIMHSNTDLLVRSDDGRSHYTDDSNALGTWSFGDFDEKITIDLKAAIQSKNNYPSDEFKIQAYPEDGVCLGSNSETFTVPQSYMP